MPQRTTARSVGRTSTAAISTSGRGFRQGNSENSGQRRRPDVGQRAAHSASADLIPRRGGYVHVRQRQERGADAEPVGHIRAYPDLEPLANLNVLRRSIGEVDAVDGDRGAGQVALGKP